MLLFVLFVGCFLGVCSGVERSVTVTRDKSGDTFFWSTSCEHFVAQKYSATQCQCNNKGTLLSDARGLLQCLASPADQTGCDLEFSDGSKTYFVDHRQVKIADLSDVTKRECGRLTVKSVERWNGTGWNVNMQPLIRTTSSISNQYGIEYSTSPNSVWDAKFKGHVIKINTKCDGNDRCMLLKYAGERTYVVDVGVLPTTISTQATTTTKSSTLTTKTKTTTSTTPITNDQTTEQTTYQTTKRTTERTTEHTTSTSQSSPKSETTGGITPSKPISSESSESDDSTGLIVGIVASILLLVAIAMVLVLCYFKRKKRKTSKAPLADGENTYERASSIIKKVRANNHPFLEPKRSEPNEYAHYSPQNPPESRPDDYLTPDSLREQLYEEANVKAGNSTFFGNPSNNVYRVPSNQPATGSKKQKGSKRKFNIMAEKVMNGIRKTSNKGYDMKGNEKEPSNEQFTRTFTNQNIAPQWQPRKETGIVIPAPDYLPEMEVVKKKPETRAGTVRQESFYEEAVDNDQNHPIIPEIKTEELKHPKKTKPSNKGRPLPNVPKQMLEVSQPEPLYQSPEMVRSVKLKQSLRKLEDERKKREVERQDSLLYDMPNGTLVLNQKGMQFTNPAFVTEPETSEMSSEDPYEIRKKAKSENPYQSRKMMTSENPYETRKKATSEDPYASRKKTTSENPYETRKRATSEDPYASRKKTTSENPYETRKKATSEDPYASRKKTTSENPYETRKKATSEDPYASRKKTTSENPCETRKEAPFEDPYTSRKNITSENPYGTRKKVPSEDPYETRNKAPIDGPYEIRKNAFSENPYGTRKKKGLPHDDESQKRAQPENPYGSRKKVHSDTSHEIRKKAIISHNNHINRKSNETEDLSYNPSEGLYNALEEHTPSNYEALIHRRPPLN